LLGGWRKSSLRLRVLLVALALAADHATAVFFDGEKWVAHTHGVQMALAQLRTRMFQAQAARLDDVVTGDEVANLRLPPGYLCTLFGAHFIPL
jgi:hypothetical protein